MPSTFKVISLGNLGFSLDPDEFNIVSENAAALVGTNFNSFTSANLVTWSAVSYSSLDSAGYVTTYNQDSSFGTDTFQITDTNGTQTTHSFDALVRYEATITYADGTTASGEILIAQDTAGNAYVMPPSVYTPQAILDADITGICIDGLPLGGDEYAGLYFDRADLPNQDTSICFARGTAIEADGGAIAVEDLREGDLVVTRDNGLQPIRWIGFNALSASMLAKNENLRPIRIHCGALGIGTPLSDLLVSPQHRVLIRSAIARRIFGVSEVLIAAKHLCELEGIEIAHDVKGVDYYHILFERHEIIIANGAEAESLYTGPEALKSIDPKAFSELSKKCPEVTKHGFQPIPARRFPQGRLARMLVRRHQQNGKQLVSQN